MFFSSPSAHRNAAQAHGTHPTSPRQLRRRSGIVLATAATFTALTLLPTQATTETTLTSPLAGTATAAPSDKGQMNWGIRSSFNNYTGGATKIDKGATRAGNGFQFTLTDIDYNKEKKTTTAQFAGTVIYRKYCENADPMTGYCKLDLRFSDPKIVLSSEGSFIYATVSSKQYPDGGTTPPQHQFPSHNSTPTPPSSPKQTGA